MVPWKICGYCKHYNGNQACGMNLYPRSGGQGACKEYEGPEPETELWVVVGIVDYEFSDVLGVFSSEEKADVFKKKAKKRKSCKHYDGIIKDPFILDKER